MHHLVLHIFMLYNLLGTESSFYRKSKINVKGIVKEKMKDLYKLKIVLKAISICFYFYVSFEKSFFS